MPLTLPALPFSCGELGAEEAGDNAALLLSAFSLSLSRLVSAKSFLAGDVEEDAAVGEVTLLPAAVGEAASSALPCLLPIALI